MTPKKREQVLTALSRGVSYDDAFASAHFRAAAARDRWLKGGGIERNAKAWSELINGTQSDKKEG